MSPNSNVQTPPLSDTITMLHEKVRQILNNRFASEQMIISFLSKNLRELPDLGKLIDLEKASTRILDGVSNSQAIGIYGDYDVDGATSCALLYQFFKMLEVPVKIFQPNRLEDGYGIHSSILDTIIEQDIKILISVDCGITNVEAAEHARTNNLDLIITDHHTDIAKILPNAYAIINPNRRDEDKKGPLSKLAGVGVAFALALQIKKDWDKRDNVTPCPSLYPLLQYVAIGTLADQSPLTPMNLKLVRHGLKQLPQTNYPGLKVFLSTEERSLPSLPSDKVSFSIAPLINSQGRLGKADKAIELLITDDPYLAQINYQHLQKCNSTRKELQAQVFKEAKQQIITNTLDDDSVINVVYEPHWHEGVVGIVASKLVDDFKVPAIVLTNTPEQGFIKGSVRSIGALNIFDCLLQCQDLFTKFGGHAAAAGLSLPLTNLHPLRQKLKDIIKAVPLSLRTPLDTYDCTINLEEITPKLVKDLEILEPFGNRNLRPKFKMDNIKLDQFKIIKDEHVKWFFSSLKDPRKKIQAISFYYVKRWEAATPAEILEGQKNSPLSVIFTLGINHYRGNEYIQLFAETISY